ncbi:MAG: helix-turn-helix transcriptional regulator [Planctomycetota bacterium]
MDKREKRRRVTEADERVSAELRRLRIDTGLTQTEIAAVLGVSFQQWQKYERGENRISAGGLFRLLQGIGMSPAEFFRRLEQSTRSPSRR